MIRIQDYTTYSTIPAAVHPHHQLIKQTDPASLLPILQIPRNELPEDRFLSRSCCLQYYCPLACKPKYAHFIYSENIDFI